MTRRLLLSIAGLLLFVSVVGSFRVYARDYNDAATFEVTVTNLTRGQTFTPILVASHKRGVSLFKLGDPASVALEILAEGGAVGPLETLLLSMPEVKDTSDSGGLLAPGDSVTVEVKTRGRFDHISVVSMLIPTNDAFFSLNGVKGPRGKRTVTLVSPAYDAGTEANDEDCDNIPGPVCGGMGDNPDRTGAEGYVHIHAGIHGIGKFRFQGDLDASERDWRNPVALISIRRRAGDDDDD